MYIFNMSFVSNKKVQNCNWLRLLWWVWACCCHDLIWILLLFQPLNWNTTVRQIQCFQCSSISWLTSKYAWGVGLVFAEKYFGCILNTDTELCEKLIPSWTCSRGRLCFPGVIVIGVQTRAHISAVSKWNRLALCLIMLTCVCRYVFLLWQ